MKVLQLGPYPPPYGGVQTNLVAIRSFLRKKGVPCAVINVTRHRKPEADDVYYPSSPAGVLRLLRGLKYDIVHQHFGGMLTNRILSLSLVCTLQARAKSVMTFHSGGFPSTPEGIAMGPHSFSGWVLRRFDGLIAVNTEIMTFFKKMGVSSNRARLISPYSFTKDEESSSSFPAHLDSFFETHDPVLISAGQLEPEYDLSLQIEVMPNLRKRFPDAGLVLLGSGSLEKDLRTKIESQQCSQHTLLAGDVAHDSTMEAISRSRIMLRTTWYDGDAISVREALQVGTPVIATDNAMRPPGIRLIPKSDSAALLRSIEEELQQPFSRQNSVPTDDSSLQAVFDFYQDLLAEK